MSRRLDYGLSSAPTQMDNNDVDDVNDFTDITVIEDTTGNILFLKPSPNRYPFGICPLLLTSVKSFDFRIYTYLNYPL